MIASALVRPFLEFQRWMLYWMGFVYCDFTELDIKGINQHSITIPTFPTQK